MVWGNPKPAFMPAELPLNDVRRKSSAAATQSTRRRSSVFQHIWSSPSQPDHDDRLSESGPSARNFSLVPSFARKASLHSEQLNRARRGTRRALLGETNIGEKEATMSDHFFKSKLTLDNSDDEEFGEKQETVLELKGKGRAGWSDKLGWDAAPPKGRKRGTRVVDDRKRHRNRRVVRELDNDLDAFNSFTRNGQTPISRSGTPSRNHSRSNSINSRDPSVHSVSDILNQPIEQHAPGPLDSASDRPRAVLVGDGFDAVDVMADQIFRIGVQKKKWFKPPRMGDKRDRVATGVSIRVKTGLYRTFPVGYDALDEFEEAMTRLNPEVGIKIKSRIVHSVMDSFINPDPEMSELVIDANTRIQILEEIDHLARARKHQYAAFVRSEQVLVVWADHVESVIPAAEALEDALIQFIWHGGNDKVEPVEEKVQEQPAAAPEGKKRWWKRRNTTKKPVVVEAEEDLDPEDAEMRRVKKHWRERPVMLWAPISDGLAIILVICLIALGLRTLVKEYALDGQATRFALVIFSPAIAAIAAFACNCVVGSFFQILGPIRQVTQNSKYYSGVAPKRTMGELAHVTVQMPVYKESLEEVIMPTITSLKKAITTYERQGGSVGILICDDGLQLLSQQEADKRRSFYFDNNIAYVSRPGHNQNGFIRKGRFKKAGNMNYANGMSLRVEEIMDEIRPTVQETLPAEHFWCDTDENAVYDQALAKALEERNGETWAAGNIRIGSIILIIDSDTRVPEDCFADAVSEMAESPEVAIIQHMSGVMQVANHFFENGVAHFTRGIQHAISYCAASGEVAPFVGHNAFLRWSALQECFFTDPDDGKKKIWSEDHVSEDFQIAVTLQIKGYDVRWASYSGGEFEEGVSLTCDDELNRWQKYAFGCSELMFFPFRRWFTKGPVTPLIRQFFWSNIPLHSKYSIMGYIFSYYAIACAWLLTVANYFLIGFDLPIDDYYLPSWEVFLICVILFVGLCNLAFIVLRYRLKLPGSSQMAFDQIKWIPFFSIFFTGMSMPMSAALVSHLVGYNMTWSTTIKTVEKSNFFLQIPIIWKRFYPQLVFFTLMMAVMIVTSSSIFPVAYRIGNVEVFVPMGVLVASHLLWPFALNPWFLSFSF